jgi:hypothetical protein
VPTHSYALSCRKRGERSRTDGIAKYGLRGDDNVLTDDVERALIDVELPNSAGDIVIRDNPIGRSQLGLQVGLAYDVHHVAYQEIGHCGTRTIDDHGRVACGILNTVHYNAAVAVDPVDHSLDGTSTSSTFNTRDGAMAWTLGDKA